MTALSIERLRRDGQAFMEEISREYYLSGAGLKPTADLQPIYHRHEAVIGTDADVGATGEHAVVADDHVRVVGVAVGSGDDRSR